LTDQSTESARPSGGGDHGGHGTGAYLVTLLSTLGVVYGDIGTSPLYAFRESFEVADLEVTESSVLGVLSLIFWALVLVVTVKYLVFVLRADNDGEGGILALTSLIMDRAGERRGRLALIAVGLFGTALLYGDGMITPAISVLSAVEGLEVTFPTLGNWVLVVTCVILAVLFMNQHRGTAMLGKLFGPIMVVWFGVLAILGLIQIAGNPAVVKAISPLVFVEFMFDRPGFAFLALGGVFLVVTGSEALYADLGHFGVRPIRHGWFGLVFPALVINYFGQGALLIDDPEAIENPFYALAPTWGVVPLVVLATLATIIASQALISGAYSLTSQAIQLGFLPRLNIDHTSPVHMGQIFVRSINWLLMVASIGLVIGFQTSSNLAAAYGVGVAADMVITSLLLSMVMRDRWGWSPVLAIGLSSGFLAVDLVFFGANVTKIPGGGWFPLVIGVIGFLLMTTWRTGRRLTAASLRQQELPIEQFIASITEYPQQRVSGTGVYLFREAGLTPPTLLTNLRHHEVLHETIILVAVEVVGRPRVRQARRATVEDLGQGFFQVVLTYGFMEDPDVPRDLGNIVSGGFGFDPRGATYFLGRESVLATDRPGMAIWRERLFAFLHRNAADAADAFSLPSEAVVEVGVQVPI
jgi:KUP system potassium uptake protein